VEGKLEEMKNQMLVEIPKRVKESFLEDLVVEGMAPIGRSDIALMLNEQYDRIINTFTAGNIIQPVSQNIAALPTPLDGPRFIQFHWGGMFRAVPEDFQFPTCETKTMWDFWYYGNGHLGILPYKKLKNYIKTDFKAEVERSNYSRVTMVIHLLENIAKAVNPELNGVEFDTLPRQETDGIFNESYTILMNHLYPQEANRPGDVKYTTLANRIYSKPPINLQNVGNN
jgi:hypothetical protein